MKVALNNNVLIIRGIRWGKNPHLYIEDHPDRAIGRHEHSFDGARANFSLCLLLLTHF